MKNKPYASAAVLSIIILMCLIAPCTFGSSATRMDFYALNMPPSGAHLFGTDELGRDIFKMLFQGGRVSLFIGLFSSVIAAVIAIIYGALAGLAPKWLESVLMRFAELIMSIPSILYVVSLLAILGKPTVMSLSVVIGVTSWTSIAKIVRAEVRQIHKSEFVLSAKLSGAKFVYVLRQHLFPNFIPAIMFMLIYNVCLAIVSEATLSFIGLGLPPNTASWGTLISLAQDALLTNSWWIILIPTSFLIATIVAITNIGEYLRRSK